MKNFNKSKISAFMALMLAGTILASASTPINNDSTDIAEEDSLKYEDHYLEDIDTYVNEYFDEHVVQFETTDYVKVYDVNQQLIVEGEKTNLQKNQLKLLRQADLLSELNGTAYYQINN